MGIGIPFPRFSLYNTCMIGESTGWGVTWTVRLWDAHPSGKTTPTILGFGDEYSSCVHLPPLTHRSRENYSVMRAQKCSLCKETSLCQVSKWSLFLHKTFVSEHNRHLQLQTESRLSLTKSVFAKVTEIIKSKSPGLTYSLSRSIEKAWYSWTIYNWCKINTNHIWI